MILNLGAGKKLRTDAFNIDMVEYPGIDDVVDLREYPWPWKDWEVEGIYVSHVLEHFPDQEKFLMECHRILRPGGFLRIAGPHSSCVSSIGHLGHYRTYCYNAFDDNLSKPSYMFKKPLFKTIEKRLNWWHEEVDAEGHLPKWTIPVIKAVDWVLSSFANRVPRLTENIICPAIQFREVIWQGIKIYEPAL